MHDNKMQKY